MGEMSLMANAGLSELVSTSKMWVNRRLMIPTKMEWTFSGLCGCLVELSGAAASPLLTVACKLVRQAQQHGDPVAWIAQSESIFFPPDVAGGGVDLMALPVIRLADNFQRMRAADQLARSGAFGLLVIDLCGCLELPVTVQIRLARQAFSHATLILCLTKKTDRQPSLGSFVSVRGHTKCIRHRDNRFECQVHVIKDKRCGPGWSDKEWCCGPAGVR